VAEAGARRSLPSLIGGIFTAIVAFALWLLLVGTGHLALIVVGAIAAIALGIWVRLADL